MMVWALVQPLFNYGRASKIQKGIRGDAKNSAGMPNNSPAAMNQGRLSFERMVLPQKLSGSLESSLLGTAQLLQTLQQGWVQSFGAGGRRDQLVGNVSSDLAKPSITKSLRTCTQHAAPIGRTHQAVRDTPF